MISFIFYSMELHTSVCVYITVFFLVPSFSISYYSQRPHLSYYDWWTVNRVGFLLVDTGDKKLDAGQWTVSSEQCPVDSVQWTV